MLQLSYVDDMLLAYAPSAAKETEEMEMVLAATYNITNIGTGRQFLGIGNHYKTDSSMCGGTVSQTREHLFRHCSRWKDHQKELWKAVGKATGWKAGRCRHVQISELFSIAECDQAVMDFLAATEVG